MKYRWHKDNVPNPDKSHYDKDNRAWYDARSKQLLADRQVKTYRELSIMYGLCTTRLQEIVKAQSRKFKGT